jgi:hypothetical protein
MFPQCFAVLSMLVAAFEKNGSQNSQSGLEFGDAVE